MPALQFSERRLRILSGLIAVTVIPAVVFVGVKSQAAHYFDRDYQLTATFDAAGQGLLAQSDVKVHGFLVGRVKSIKLRDGRATVRMDIKHNQKIPTDSQFLIRPKTLFGEKFVDVLPSGAAVESAGPFYDDEGIVPNGKTLGGFELEKVLTDAYPVLKNIKVEDIMVVLDTLAGASQGNGEKANRTFANLAKVLDVTAAHNDDTARFLHDLALLSDTLANRADDLVATAQDLNVALPELNARSGELTQLLDQTGRLSADLADLLGANQSFLVKNATEGGKVVGTLFDNRSQIGPLLTGLRQFIQTLAEVGRIPYPGNPGTVLAAVKGLTSEEDCTVGGRSSTCGKVQTLSAPRGATINGPALPGQVGTVTIPGLTGPSSGVQAVKDLLEGLVGKG